MANALGMSAIGVGTVCIRMRIRVDLGYTESSRCGS